MKSASESSTMYQLMRQSEYMDDDGMDICDAIHNADTTSDFISEYLSFYSDIKTSTRDDW